jgi:hypothetical protein
MLFQALTNQVLMMSQLHQSENRNYWLGRLQVFGPPN